jgi:hypothetical protein
MADRQAFAAALGTTMPLLFIECPAPARSSPSGRPAASATRGACPTPTLPWRSASWRAGTARRGAPSAHLVVRTDRSSDQVLGDVLALLDQRRLDVT